MLGSGNIEIESGETYTAGTGINISNTNEIINTITSYNDLTDLPTIPTKLSDLSNDEDFVSSSELANVAFTGDYLDLDNQPVIPTETSELTNNGEDGSHPFIPNYDSTNLKGITTNNGRLSWLNGISLINVDTANYSDLSSKQDTLVSGTNIKTINNNSILGSGNLNISGGSATDVQINGTSIVSNNTANIITESAYNSSTNKIATKNDIPTLTSQLTNDSNFINSIKTINNNSLIGSGNLQLNGIGCWYSNGTITWSSTWSWEKIPIWGTIYDNANFILYANGIYIPAGVSLIKITINCSLYNVDCGGDKNLAIYKNGVLNRSIAYVNYDTTNKYINMTGQTVLNVTQSDEISVQLNSELAGTMRIFDSTTFTIEILG